MTTTPTACAVNSHEYDFARLEPQWQQYWEAHSTFRASDDPAAGPKYYALDMFPYPSGAGLHIGHPEGYTATDILARMKKAQGYNVLHPMGWDAFGLPAEQHALATGIPPAVNTAQNIANFKRQIKSLGFGLDWSREIDSTDPQYYRWTQWIFLQLFKRGLAYVDEKPVWWCQALGTVLANEEVIDGRSERGNHPVERRPLRQWVLRITAHAERLLKGLEDLNWPESTKRQQVAWIGKSEGTQLHFSLVQPQPDPSQAAAHAHMCPSFSSLSVYTTCAHTLMGVTFISLAPEHPLAAHVAAQPSSPQQQALAQYLHQAASKSDLDRSSANDAQKTGVFTGLHAYHPITQAPIPIWVADYVLPHYGTGAVMGVPAHDARDFAFARRYQLPIQPVVANPDGTPATLPYTDEGPLVHSGPYDGLWPHEARQRITRELAQQGKAQATTQYKLRDWLFSRQRYWGEPFPIVWVRQDAYNAVLADPSSPWQEGLPAEPVTYQDKDGQLYYALGLPSGHLPLTLPQVSSYQPSGTGESPLATQTSWVHVALHVPTGALVPADQAPQETGWFAATRETNTMPQWAASSWYYLRYLDPHNSQALVDPAKERYWGSPDIYIGGAEHAVLHLLYARFWHQVLFDIGLVSQPEPFQRVVHQGLILGQVEFSVFENKDHQPVSVQYVSDSSTDLRDQGVLFATKVDSQDIVKKGDVFVLRDNPDIQVEAKAYKMSKSRGNVVSPDSIIQTHGADALRLYEMFLGPLEASKPWSTHGIEGISRFLKKIWREYTDRQGQLNPKIQAHGPERADTERLLHETIQKVTDDTEHLRFNTAISQMMVFMNHIQGVPAWSHHSARVFLQLLAPYAPHIAEELWVRLGHQPSICHEPWPQADASKLVSSQVTVIVQVNGKLRGELAVAADAPEGFVVQLAHGNSKIAPWIEGKTLLKTVYVPGKILNLVVKG